MNAPGVSRSRDAESSERSAAGEVRQQLIYHRRGRRETVHPNVRVVTIPTVGEGRELGRAAFRPARDSFNIREPPSTPQSADTRMSRIEHVSIRTKLYGL